MVGTVRNPIVVKAGSTAPVKREYTASGIWTKPDNLRYLTVICIAAGGGGGSGRRGAAGTYRSGGGGGNAGFIVFRRIAAIDLAATENYTIGAGGTGGAGVLVDDTDGNAGTGGGDTSFGTLVKACGGYGGVVGRQGTVSNNSTAPLTHINNIPAQDLFAYANYLSYAGCRGFAIVAGSHASITLLKNLAVPNLPSGTTLFGGAGGSGVHENNSHFAGGNGARLYNILDVESAAIAGGLAGGGNGDNGIDNHGNQLLQMFGANGLATTIGYGGGGAGGGGNNAEAGGNGGDGGSYGGAGGGGGGCVNGFTSGKGGDGAGGCIIILEEF